jgi:hypothetical protein
MENIALLLGQILAELKKSHEEILAELKELNSRVVQSQTTAEVVIKSHQDQMNNALGALKGMIPQHMLDALNKTKGGS